MSTSGEKKELNEGMMYLLRSIKEKPGITTKELRQGYRFGDNGTHSIHFIQTRNRLVQSGLVQLKNNDWVHSLTERGQQEVLQLT